MADILIPDIFDPGFKVDHSHLYGSVDHPFMEAIDRQDTISEMIEKLNHNFSAIVGTGIFDPKEEEPEEHDYLCDALLIKPHQPIHRRKRILEPLDDRKDVSWLVNVDYLLGDIAIVEQKRSNDESCNRVFMYTISRSQNNDENIELTNETEITGPTGKSGEIFLTYDSQDIFENTTFNKLTVDKLNVSSISFLSGGSLSVPEIITNKLQIGNLTFYNSGKNSELATNKLMVEEISGFPGKVDTITFKSSIKAKLISSSEDTNPDKPLYFEDSIYTTKISANTRKGQKDILFFGSPIQSNGESIKVLSPIHVNELDCIDPKTDIIKIKSQISVNTISGNSQDGEISIISPIKVNKISSNGNSILVESPINSTNGVKFITPTTFEDQITVDENKFHFKQFDYLDKHQNFGHVFLAFDNIQPITVPTFELTSKSSLTKLGKAYSIVPTNGQYYLAKVTSSIGIWYMLAVRSSRNVISNLIRIVTTKPSVTNSDISDEETFELISSNSIYREIYNALDDSSRLVDRLYRTIGFSKINDFETVTGCTIEVKQIQSLTNSLGLGKNNMIYYLTLY